MVEEARSAAIQMGEASRAEPGCNEYGFTQDLADPSVLTPRPAAQPHLRGNAKAEERLHSRSRWPRAVRQGSAAAGPLHSSWFQEGALKDVYLKAGRSGPILALDDTGAVGARKRLVGLPFAVHGVVTFERAGGGLAGIGSSPGAEGPGRRRAPADRRGGPCAPAGGRPSRQPPGTAVFPTSPAPAARIALDRNPVGAVPAIRRVPGLAGRSATGRERPAARCPAAWPALKPP